MNVPNLLTGLRLLAAPVFVWFFLQGHHRAALAVFVGALITDWLDGVLARALKQFTQLGALLDPIADKLMALSSLSVLCGTGRLPFWLLWLTLFRETCIVVAIWLLEKGGHPYVVRPTRFGKYATAGVGLAIILALVEGASETARAALGPFVVAMALVAAEFIVVSWAQYLWMFVRLMRAPRMPVP
ncbi:MAG: CDP-alcohol phosphatidyltransferase family protein [Myxococcales bacterium]